MGIKDFLNYFNTNNINSSNNTRIPKTAELPYYDLDTIEGILSIPSTARECCISGYSSQSVYYILQRKATEYKKSKQLDLAIACLRKSNEISDSYSKPPLLEKDYLRLVKFLEADKQYEAAEREKENIYKKHPDFKDKRISNKQRIHECLTKCKKYNVDLVRITTNPKCSVCGKYEGKIFSISGKSKKYKKLPEEFISEGGICKSCIVGISIYFNMK